MTPSPGIEPGPHWWEASALATAPPLLNIFLRNEQHYMKVLQKSFTLNGHTTQGLTTLYGSLNGKYHKVVSIFGQNHAIILLLIYKIIRKHQDNEINRFLEKEQIMFFFSHFGDQNLRTQKN